jgi:hypothetical protein
VNVRNWSGYIDSQLKEYSRDVFFFSFFESPPSCSVLKEGKVGQRGPERLFCIDHDVICFGRSSALEDLVYRVHA